MLEIVVKCKFIKLFYIIFIILYIISLLLPGISKYFGFYKWLHSIIISTLRFIKIVQRKLYISCYLVFYFKIVPLSMFRVSITSDPKRVLKISFLLYKIYIAAFKIWVKQKIFLYFKKLFRNILILILLF